MAVNIDTVYQKVLAFANKEQRGYVTPQEFNLFAEQAQLEIFEQYFYDINQLSRIHGNSDEYSDIKTNIQEKINIFEKTVNMASAVLSSSVYRLGTVWLRDEGVEVEEVRENDILKMNASYLTSPTKKRPVFTLRNNTMTIYPTTINAHSCSYSYIKKPSKPNWSYVVINNKAMYDPGGAAHFELHQSEENELVYKILKFAGLSMKREDLAQGGQGLESLLIQQEKQ